MDLNKNYMLMAAIKYSLRQESESELYLKLIDKEIELEKQALKCCDKLDPEESILFMLRYADAMTWGDVAKSMKMSLRKCHKVHERILKKLNM